MPVRPNIVGHATARQKYVQAVLALKRQFTGVTTTSLGISGPSRPVSTWDRFVAWHSAVMGIAHSRPIFLPWHRLMLRTLEQLMQQALGDTNFGLPYWDWAADGQLTRPAQLAAPVWDDSCMGRAASAPGRFTLAAFPIRLATNAAGTALVQVNRPLQRNRGAGVEGIRNPSLPRRSSTAAALTTLPYDGAPWNRNSTGFRNRVEGWNPANDLHNIVHVWVGGDMLPASSPNDPVFYLNHCNEDRIWEAWMSRNGRSYLPTATPGAPVGQRLNDQLLSPFGPSVRPAQVLNMTSVYTYESLAV